MPQHFDENTIDAMIACCVGHDESEFAKRRRAALETLANGSTEIAPFARFLRGECTASELQLALPRSYTFFGARIDRQVRDAMEGAKSFHEVQELARLGRFTPKFPLDSNWRQLRGEFDRLARSEGKYHLAAFVWFATDAFERLYSGKALENYKLNEDYHKRTIGHVMVAGLSFAAEMKWFSIPPLQRTAFLENAAAWSVGLHGVVHSLNTEKFPEWIGLNDGDFNWSDLTLDQCERLCHAFPDGIREYVARGLELPPELRIERYERYWVFYYTDNLRNQLPLDDMDKCVQIWGASDAVTRYEFEQAFAHVVEPDPDNPFGKERRVFLERVGVKELLPAPSYEDTVRHMKSSRST